MEVTSSSSQGASSADREMKQFYTDMGDCYISSDVCLQHIGASPSKPGRLGRNESSGCQQVGALDHVILEAQFSSSILHHLPGRIST